MNIKLEKITELPDARDPGNIEVGHIVEGELMIEPEVGQRFWVGLGYSTSPIQEIIDANTFRTMNSIYKWEEIK